MKQDKKMGLIPILAQIKNGNSPNQISEKYNIPKQTIAYSVEKLKKLGCLEKDGHGISTIWRVLKEVPKRPKDTLKLKTGLHEIKGHAFIWNIEFLEGGYDWKQIIENYKRRYKKPTLSFKMICGGKVPRTIFKNRKIWLTKTGLTIYEPLNFFGKSSFSVKGTAVFEMDRLVKALLEVFKLNLQQYRFKCSREHFSHVHNQIARQFNDRKQRIKVEYDNKWFWIDHSDGIDEEETNDANVSVQANKFYKSQMKTGFKVTPEAVLANQDKTDKQIKELTGALANSGTQLVKYEEQNKEHLALIQEYRDESRESRKESIANRKLLAALLKKL